VRLEKGKLRAVPPVKRVQRFVLDRHGPPIQAQAGQADGQSELENKVLYGIAVLFM
jgi:hypothetical protein